MKSFCCLVALWSILLLHFGFLEHVALAAPGDSVNLDSVKECPKIIGREEWKARKRRDFELLPWSPTPYVVIHHGGTRTYCRNQKSCSAIVRAYQNFHMDNRGWWDIGYNFLIGEDGNVYEGRGWSYVGAHAPGYNSQSIGICVIGDFSDFKPDAAALITLNKLISCGVSIGKIREQYNVIGHRQARSTLCPGNSFYKYVQNLPRWTSKPVPIRFEAISNITDAPNIVQM